jgi:cytoskeletal protein CcmA (bactofilin family)
MPAKALRARVETLVGADTTVRGDIEFRGALVIEGRVTGTVYGLDPGGRLVLARQGVVEGSVELDSARIEGRVNGDVTAAGEVEIGSHGLVTGTVRGARVNVRPGGVVGGAVVQRAREAPREPPASPSHGALRMRTPRER